ncbi:MAG: transglycosylase SLT domain-containing protein [Lewinella sp.]|nr:transglycosylase SLT domain-containing protein [Lewinella sp.]
METEPFLRRLFAVCMLGCLPWLAFAHTTYRTEAELDAATTQLMDLVEEEVKSRLESLDQDLVEYRYEPVVRNIIRRYLRWEHSAGVLVGRITQYFPLIEAHLREAGLPESLKYLPIVESALRPDAISRVDAQGMWQFMEGTAREYDLRIDEWVDERLDVNRATEGAIQYLKNQYEYFGDWSLALAAYNSGKGRVRRALRRSRGSNFWSIRRYLPRETRNYVPGFIAATYLAEFYALHNISPRLPSLDLQLTETIKVERPCSFYRIAQVTGLSIETIQFLNPGYRKGYLPGYPGGHYLILPQRVAPAFREYLTRFPAEMDEPALPWAPIFQLADGQDDWAGAYQEHSLTVAEGDSLASLAQRIGVGKAQLAIWNELSALDTLQAGDRLTYFQVSQYHHLPVRDYPVLSFRLPRAEAAVHSQSVDGYLPLPAHQQAYLTLCLEQRTRPSDVAARYPYLTTDKLMATNRLRKDRRLPAGTVLYIERDTEGQEAPAVERGR